MSNIASGMGVPGYAENTIYNFFCLTVWTYEKGPMDMAKLWDNPVTYMSTKSDFGKTDSEIRRNIKKKY